MTRYGTNHFVNRRRANAYYAAMGFTKEDVARKISDREIHLGPPKDKPGQKVTLDKDGRFHVETE